jgi:nucleotide-binding universal stress UspA family protein
MERTAAEIREQYGISVKVLVTLGGRISEILQTAKRIGAGLIVMGTEGADSVSNLFSGSNSHLVVSKSEIPVLTIRNNYQNEGYKSILLPIDLSEHTRQKVNVAVQIAKMHSAKIHVLGLISNGQEEKFDGRTESTLLFLYKGHNGCEANFYR